MERYVGGREDISAPLLVLVAVALDVGSDTTRTVADSEAFADWVFVSVRDTPVGAIVVDGRTIPEGPKMTVVPSIVVVTTELRAPAPILYVVPLIMASEESMLNVKAPTVLTTYAAVVTIAGWYVVEAKATPLLFKVIV